MKIFVLFLMIISFLNAISFNELRLLRSKSLYEKDKSKAYKYKEEFDNVIKMYPKIGLKFMTTTCSYGDYELCIDLAFWYKHGNHIVKKNEEKAKYFIEQACVSAQGCAEAGAETSFFDYPEKKLHYLNQACNKGNNLGCTELGLIYLRAEDNYGSKYKKFEKHKKALALFNYACKNNYYRACNILASEYFLGKTVNKNIKKAKKLFKYSCNNGDKNGCFSLKLLNKKLSPNSSISSNSFGLFLTN